MIERNNKNSSSSILMKRSTEGSESGDLWKLAFKPPRSLTEAKLHPRGFARLFFLWNHLCSSGFDLDLCKVIWSFATTGSSKITREAYTKYFSVKVLQNLRKVVQSYEDDLNYRQCRLGVFDYYSIDARSSVGLTQKITFPNKQWEWLVYREDEEGM